MIKVIVTRGAGDLPAAGIIEPILSGSLAAAAERGRIELDTSGSQREKVPLEIDPVPDLEPNILVEVQEQGKLPWRGTVDSMSFEVTASVDDAGRVTLARSMRVDVEREEE